MARGWHLTIDEWFYYHFSNEALIPETSKLFLSIFEVCDKIVLQRGTPLAKKFHDLVEASVMYPPIQREAVRTLMRLFIQNSNKIMWAEEEIELPEDIEVKLPRHDVYLVKMCLQTANKIFITTDGKLYNAISELSDTLQIKVYMAEDFISKYPKI